MKLIAFFDGGARPTNPGHGAYGVVIKDESGTVIKADKKYLGEDVTNNEAEWRGFLRAFDLALELKPDELLIVGDSKLVISQMTGVYAVESRRLMAFKKQGDEKLRSARCRVEFRHVPSGHKAKDHGVMNNSEADALVNSILENLPRPGADPKKTLDGRRLLLEEVGRFFGGRVKVKYPWALNPSFAVRPVTFYVKMGYDDHLPSLERKVWEELMIMNKQMPVLLVYRPYGSRPAPLSFRYHGRIDAGFREIRNDRDGGMEALAAWADTVTCEEAPPVRPRTFDDDDALVRYVESMPTLAPDGTWNPPVSTKRYGFRGSAVMVLRGTWIPLRHLRGTFIYEAGRELDPWGEGSDGFRVGG